MKYCPKCCETKPLDAFYNRKAAKDGRSFWCKPCFQIWRKDHRKSSPTAREREREKFNVSRKELAKKFPDALRNSILKRKYGITLDEKQQLIEAQSWQCANVACRVPLNLTTGHLDHCHQTGRIRGVLCVRCNMGLGYFDDSPELLLGIIDYVKEQ